MKATTILLGIAVCGALAQSASAETYFRSRATGVWSAYTSWEFSTNFGSSYSNAPSGSTPGTNFPGAADHVIIDGDTVTIDDTSAVCDSFDISASSNLKVGSSGANGKLTVDGSSDASHNIQGQLQLGNSGGSRTGILLFTSVDQTVLTSGAGEIVSVFAGSKIQIANSFKLTNRMPILGVMTIECDSGTATLENYGPSALCSVERSGDFVFASNLTVQDVNPGTGVPTYSATASGARLMWMNTNDYSLLGNFLLSPCDVNPALDARFYIATNVKVDSNGGTFTGGGGGPAGQVIFQTQSSPNSKLEWGAGTNINVDTDYCP